MTALSVDPAELADLTDRLRRTRWPTVWPGDDPGELRRLVAYWADGYDWRAHEAALNALPWHHAELSGTAVHYLRFDAPGPGARPIVITHGWPSSVLELVDLARRLAAANFTVVVPSLPGFGLSPQRPTVPPDAPTHELWHRLMRDELGFTRYAAHGGDLGAGITSRLAEAHPDALTGIHLLAVAGPPTLDPATITPAERAYLDAQTAWDAEEGAYQHQQMTRPITLSYGLSDSPAGLLAWLLEKYRAWSDRPFTDDFVLTQASLYWFTNTISTSFRPYYEHFHSTSRVQRVTVPTAVALFPKDLSRPPRSWAERTYNVTRYTVMPRGGHFAAHEEPGLLAADIKDFFQDLPFA